MDIDAFAARVANTKLEPFSYQAPTLEPYEILIKISHCGVCHSDLHLLDNEGGRSQYPLVPGHEVVGTVQEKGSAVTLPLGARVGVSWYLSACLQCPSCLAGETQICPKKKATCIGHYGGFAKHMTADSRFVYAIPEKLDSAFAAPLLCAGATVYAPLRKWNIQAPNRVAVIGIGGLGHLALQFAKAFGCRVTAISSSTQKKEEALSFGASHFITLDELKKDPSRWALSFDLILSTVSASLDWDLICSLLTYSGRLCVLGRSKAAFTIDVLSSLSTYRSITGSTVANRAMIQEMLEFATEHSIHPKVELMPMSQVNEAIEKVRQNKARYRIVLTA